MPTKNPTPIGQLLKEELGKVSYQKFWYKNKILQICKTYLPFIVGKIKACYMKKNTLYLQLDSRLLTHEMVLNKSKILKRLQDARQTLEDNIEIKNIVFL